VITLVEHTPALHAPLPHDMHATPPAPHALLDVAVTHWPAPQQPEHDVPSHAQMPLAQ
jgi:hypothetical protein